LEYNFITVYNFNKSDKHFLNTCVIS